MEERRRRPLSARRPYRFLSAARPFAWIRRSTSSSVSHALKKVTAAVRNASARTASPDAQSVPTRPATRSSSSHSPRSRARSSAVGGKARRNSVSIIDGKNDTLAQSRFSELMPGRLARYSRSRDTTAASISSSRCPRPGPSDSPCHSQPRATIRRRTSSLVRRWLCLGVQAAGSRVTW